MYFTWTNTDRRDRSSKLRSTSPVLFVSASIPNSTDEGIIDQVSLAKRSRCPRFSRPGSPTRHFRKGMGLSKHHGATLTFSKTQYSGSYLYTACIACVKLSILCQYNRILGPTARPHFRWQVWTLMAVVGIWALSIFTLSITICIPLEKFWNPTKPGSCLDLTAFYYGLQIPNIFTDLLILVCPIWEVYHQYPSHVHGSKHARSSMKAAIGMMFTLGLL